jgi:hypothetical protein
MSSYFLHKRKNNQQNFMDFIDQLRQKPPGTKKRIAYITSAVVTLVIFGIWVSVLHFDIGQKSADATATVADSSNTDVNPFSAFWSVLSTGWDGLANNINQIKTGVSEVQNFANGISAATSTATPIATSTDVVILDKITQ